MAFAHRSGLATLLAVLGGALVVLGASGLWVQRTIGEADAFAALAGDLVERPEIRVALAEAALDPLLEDAPALLSLQRELAVELLAELLEDERFVVAFRQVLRLAHTRLIEGERGPVEITLERVVRVARDDLAQISPELAARVDAIETPEIVVVARDEAQALRTLLAFERAVSLVLLLAGGSMVVVAVARNGSRALAPAGAAVLLASAALFVILLATRTGVLARIQEGRARDAAGAGWDVVVEGLLWTLGIAAVAGVAAIVAGGIQPSTGDSLISASSTASTSSVVDR
jgi:hypothetical protein